MSPLNSYITAARGKWSVGRAITLTQALYNIGAIAGPLIGGFIGEKFGLQSIYFFSALVFLVSTLMILFIRPQAVGERITESGKGLFNNKRFFAFMCVVFVAVFAMYLPQPLTSNFLQNQRELALNQIGVLGSIGSLGNVILLFGFGFLSTQAGFLLGQVAVWLFAILLWQGQVFPIFAAAYFLFGGYRAARALVTAQVRELISETNMGLAYGMAETISGIAIILAPPLAGWLYTFSPIRVYPVASGLIIVSLIISGSYYMMSKRGKGSK